MSKDRARSYGAEAIYNWFDMGRRKNFLKAFPQHEWKGVNPMGNENKSGS
ncbi:MAG: hypothetical protein STSR0004_21300 [Peptococcaceae bacterium]